MSTKNKLKKSPKQPPKTGVKAAFRFVWSVFAHTWRRNIWNKIWITIVVIIFFMISTMYGIAQWYIFTHRNVPVHYGVTFIPKYAEYFGVDPKETLKAILTELHPNEVRLVSYWDDIETSPGVYDFSKIDWQFDMAKEYNVKVSLAIGLRQPRWPECHIPAWQLNQPKDVWYPKLKDVMTATVNRYKDNPALESYQLENEFFLSVFGECPDFSRDRLAEEYNMVKKLDDSHAIIVSRSNNAIGFPINDPKPDAYGVSVYKRVWDRTITHRYVEYPFPAWFYGFLAGGSKLIDGRELMIHELQAEAWTPNDYEIKTAPVDELYKSLSPERLRERFAYGRATGIKQMDLWGAEWWYAMKVNRGEPALWNVAVEEFQKAQ